MKSLSQMTPVRNERKFLTFFAESLRLVVVVFFAGAAFFAAVFAGAAFFGSAFATAAFLVSALAEALVLVAAGAFVVVAFLAVAFGLTALLAVALVEAFSLITGFFAATGFALVAAAGLALEAGFAVLDSGLFCRVQVSKRTCKIPTQNTYLFRGRIGGANSFGGKLDTSRRSCRIGYEFRGMLYEIRAKNDIFTLGESEDVLIRARTDGLAELGNLSIADLKVILLLNKPMQEL